MSGPRRVGRRHRDHVAIGVDAAAADAAAAHAADADAAPRAH